MWSLSSVSDSPTQKTVARPLFQRGSATAFSPPTLAGVVTKASPAAVGACPAASSKTPAAKLRAVVSPTQWRPERCCTIFPVLKGVTLAGMLVAAPTRLRDSTAEMTDHTTGPDQLVPAEHVALERGQRGAQRRHIKELPITEALQYQERQQAPNVAAFALQRDRQGGRHQF